MKTILYPIYLLVIVFGVWRLQHFRYVSHLRALQPVSFKTMQERAGISPELLNSIGSISTDRRPGRYFFFDKIKKKGVIRAGVLGGSDALGLEVQPGLDFPAQLQGLLQKHGFAKVEVINFAGAGWGFHQAFRFWDKLAKDYDLDFLLLGPTWFEDRDSTFNYGTPFFPYNIHGRYILDREDVKFVDVIGGRSYEDRFENYFRFIPHIDYVRYDRRPPSAVQSLLFGDRDLKNPFYYYPGSLKEEWARIHEKLLEKIVEGNRQVIYSELDPPIVGRKIPGGIPRFALPEIQEFPYWRVAHPSAFGQALIAKMYFGVLTGKADLQFSRLLITWGTQAESGSGIALDQFDDGSLRIGKKNMGGIFYAQKFGSKEERVNFRKDGIKSLLALERGEAAELRFVPLNFELGPIPSIEVVTAAGERFPFGEIEFIHRSPDIARIRISRRNAPFSKYVADLEKRWGSFRLAAGENIIFKSRPSVDGAELEPAQGRFVEARAEIDSFFDIEGLPKSGELTLVLGGEKPLDVKLANWEKMEQTSKYDRTLLKAYVQK